MADINLLPAEEKRSEQSLLLHKRLTLAAFAVLAFTVIATVATLAFFILAVQKREEVSGRIEDASGRINAFKSVEELLVVTKDKAASADKILSQRVDYLSFLNTLSEIVPTNVYFIDIKFGGSKIDFVGKARTSADMAALVSSLSSGKGAQLASGVSIDQLSADETAVYSFVISAQLPDASAQAAKSQ